MRRAPPTFDNSLTPVPPCDEPLAATTPGPRQGVAHFCLVGSGGDGGAGAIRQRKNTAPSDLSGEAMGLRTASLNKPDGTSPGGGISGLVGDLGPRSDRGGTGDGGGGSAKPDGGAGGGGRDNNSKDGGFFGGFSRAISRGVYGGQAAGRDGEEEEIGREEDVQVARFVLMLLQYNFPYITHVRGDMAACLEELSAQVRGKER